MSQQLNHNDVIIVDKKYVYNGFFKMALYRLQHKKFDHSWTPVLERELLERPKVAAVLPYDPQLDKVVLLRQFRLGVLEGNEPPWQWEIVAGICDYDESLDALAHREAQEEAGLTLNALKPITQYWVSPGGTNERVMLYCGIVDASQAGGIWGVAAEHEDIEVHTFPFETAYAGLREGWINNAASIISMQWLALNRDCIRTQNSKK